MIKQEPVGPAPCARLSAPRVQRPRGPMEIRLTLRRGMSGTKKLLARYGERLVCVRYRYDRATGRRVKTAELIVEDVAWAGRRVISWGKNGTRIYSGIWCHIPVDVCIHRYMVLGCPG